jgi:hypothetical protein
LTGRRFATAIQDIESKFRAAGFAAENALEGTWGTAKRDLVIAEGAEIVATMIAGIGRVVLSLAVW